MRTITVKGMGKVSTAPDYIVISMSLVTHKYGYEETMEDAADCLNYLNSALENVGFEKNAVKTTSFNVNTEYRSVKDKNGNYTRVFDGYVCSHRLKVEFDFDTKRLAKTLSAISGCLADPEMSVHFTVKDPSAINKELLKSATINAKEKAEVLCEASNVELGQLLNIDYNWGEINVISRTEYDLEEKCLKYCDGGIADIDITPDDIDVSDTATFIWEIK